MLQIGCTFFPTGQEGIHADSTDDAPELCGRAGDMVASTALQSQGFAVTIDDSCLL